MSALPRGPPVPACVSNESAPLQKHLPQLSAPHTTHSTRNFPLRNQQQKTQRQRRTDRPHTPPAQVLVHVEGQAAAITLRLSSGTGRGTAGYAARLHGSKLDANEPRFCMRLLHDQLGSGLWAAAIQFEFRVCAHLGISDQLEYINVLLSL